MRNLLKTISKLLSSGLVLTGVFLLSFGTVYAAPNIESFTVNDVSGSLQVQSGSGLELKWKATGAAGCYVESTEDVGADGLPVWSQVSNSIFSSSVYTVEPGTDTFTYTITCYELVQEETGPSQAPTLKNYTVANPYTGPAGTRVTGSGQKVSKAVSVKVLDQSNLNCPTEGAGAAVCNLVCENAPGEEACDACKGPNGATSKECQKAYQCFKNGGQSCETSISGLQKQTQPPAEVDCGITGIANLGQCLYSAGIFLLDWQSIPMAASFLQLSSYLFEFAIQISIVQFSSLVTSGDWLTNIWRTIRDILNIFVIFILLYSAIKIIVGQGEEIKKLISGVILFGVLTNFSLFLTKAAVDLSNIVALEFYQQMRNAPLNELSFSAGLGATIVQTSKLTNFYDVGKITDEGRGGVSSAVEDNLKNSVLRKSILYRVMMIFVFVAVAFVFLQATFLFLSRTITVILLLIFSPLMFAEGIFTPLKEKIAQWRNEFIGQIIFAPLFMILLYVSLTIMKSLVETIDDQLKGDGTTSATLGLSILTSTLTILAFGMTLSVSKEYAGSIGSKAAGLGTKAVGMVGGLGLAGVASGLRTTARVMGVKKFSNWAENSDSVLASGARFLGMNKIKDSTFDIRNSKFGTKVGGGVAAALGMSSITQGADFGSGSKTTLQQQKSVLEAVSEKYKAVQKGVQERADKRGETRVEKALQDIEEKEKKEGIKSDYEVFDFTLKYRDEEGNIQTVERGSETDEEWVKKVKKANQKNKSYIESKKQEYLKKAPVLAADTRGKNFISRRALVAEYRAREKFAKKFKESDETKLKAYTDDLKKDEYKNILGVTDAQIDAMNDDERIALWETLGKEAEKEIKDINSKLDPTPGPDRNEQLERRNKWATLSTKAKNASKKINELKKKIDAAKNKKDEDKPKDDQKK